MKDINETISTQVAIGAGEGEAFKMGATEFLPVNSLPALVSNPVAQAKLDTLSAILIEQASGIHADPVVHATVIHTAFTALEGGKLISKDNAQELAGAVADVAETYHKTGDLRAAILGAVFNFFGHK